MHCEFLKTAFLSLPQQVELALAYACETSLDPETLVQYIHQNRNHNTMRIETLGKKSKDMKRCTPPIVTK